METSLVNFYQRKGIISEAWRHLTVPETIQGGVLALAIYVIASSEYLGEEDLRNVIDGAFANNRRNETMEALQFNIAARQWVEEVNLNPLY